MNKYPEVRGSSHCPMCASNFEIFQSFCTKNGIGFNFQEIPVPLMSVEYEDGRKHIFIKEGLPLKKWLPIACKEVGISISLLANFCGTI